MTHLQLCTDWLIVVCVSSLARTVCFAGVITVSLRHTRVFFRSRSVLCPVSGTINCFILTGEYALGTIAWVRTL